jgi:drug/metabolite transporter (DMT)-like permease
VLTAVGPVAHILMVTYGIHWSTPFSSSLILACGPVFTLLLMRFGHGTRLHRQQVLGVALALAGVLVFMGDKLLGADWRAGGGDLLLLVAAALFSAYTVGIAPLIVRHGGVDVTCWTMVLACPALMLATAVPAWHAPFATAHHHLGGLLLGGAGVGLHGLDAVGLDQCRARRGPHRAADVPDPAGGRTGGVADGG